MHLFWMAQLNAQSKRRVGTGETEASLEGNPPPETDLRATIALSPEALAALIDEVKKAQGEASAAAEAANSGEAPDAGDPALEELTAPLQGVRRPPLPKRPGGE
jgi:hypothetical protein